MPQGTAHQGQKKKAVTSLGHEAVTKTGMAGKHSRFLVFLEGGGSECSLGMCLAALEGSECHLQLLLGGSGGLGREELEGE